MSTSFSFPLTPTLNQIVVLPDGNSAQWNGYAWVAVGDNVTYPLAVPKGGTGATNPFTAKRNLDIPIWTLDDAAPAAPVFGDRWIRPGSMTEVVWLPNSTPAGGGVWVNLADVGSVAYPIPVSKGGTGATTAAGARTNLGIDPLIAALLPLDGSRAMTGVLGLADGTVAAPGLAWASEPGLGLLRSGAGKLYWAQGGIAVWEWDFSGNPTTSFNVFPKANGVSAMAFHNLPNTNPNRNYIQVLQHTDGRGFITCSTTGTATRGNLILDATQVVVAPSGLNAALRMDASIDSAQGMLMGSRNGVTYWQINMPSPVPGNNLQFIRFNGSGAFLDVPIEINWANAVVSFSKAIINGPSDRRLKDNIEPLKDSLAKVTALQGVSFNMRTTPEQREIGLIANDVEPVVPEIIQPYGDGFMAIDYPKLTALLIESVKTLDARLKAAGL